MPWQRVFRKTRTELQSAGFTLIELLIVVALIAILAAISVPAMLRARASGNEAAAVGSLRALNSAETSYAVGAGQGGFATSLVVLGTSCPGAAASFISQDLSTDPSIKSGYTITLAAAAGSGPGPTDCNGVGTQTAYYSTAVPVAAGVSGARAFASSGAGTIFFDGTGVPPTEAQMAPGGGGNTIQ